MRSKPKVVRSKLKVMRSKPEVVRSKPEVMRTKRKLVTLIANWHSVSLYFRVGRAQAGLL
ncbi:MAG TPA: hypothetical protein VLF09_04085 [Cellvibrio sp.]|nr:hypothetical protein [Cellvibrio sp.]